MAMNLEAILRIAAQVTGVENITKLEKSLQGAEKAADAAGQGFKAVLNSSAWQATAAAAAGFGVAMGVAVKAAIDFESSMADVRKVVDGLENPKAFAEMKAEILDLSRQMPIAAEGFAEIYAAAGQSGIAKDELKGFATMVAQVAVAFDMTANEAGTALAQMKVALGLSTEEVRSLADAMNYVSNNTGSTASSLVEFMSRSGSAGKIAGLSAEETMAFGAAMIQTGVQSEVAATSFNNMIKALSKGSSMTEKQTSALRRMGYSLVDAKGKEKELTQAVERESRERMDAARAETDALSKEVNRRYRLQMQALEDTWDDEADAYEDALQDRADDQVKYLRRQQDAEVKAAQARAEAGGYDADPEVDRINDRYDKIIDGVRKEIDDQLKMRRRADRDRRQAIKDSLDDQRDAELAAIERKYKEQEELEKQFLEAAKERAKAEAKELADVSAQSFADRLQTEGAPVIMEVLKKIAALPKSQQISVLSDMFGDEARGLAPLLANLGELERVMGLATDKIAAAGSVTAEFESRAQTTQNALQLMNNQLTALGVEVGSVVLPVLVDFLKALTPIIEGLGTFARQNPLLTTALVTIGGIVSSLVLAAPFIVSVITLLGKLGISLAGIGGTIAGWSAVLLPIKAAFLGFLGWVGSTFIPGLLAFFAAISPVGWIAIAIAGVTLLVIAFREQLAAFAVWLWEWGEPIREFWAGLWEGVKEAAIRVWDSIKEPLTTYFTWVKGSIEWWGKTLWAVWWQIFVQPFINAWDTLKEPISQFFGWVQNAAGTALSALPNIAWQLWVQPWINLWNSVLREPVTAAWSWLQGIWQGISEAFMKYVAEPISNAWNAVITALPKAMESAVKFIQGIWTGMVNGVKSAIRGMLQFMADRINIVAGLVNRLIQGFNALPGVFDIPYVPTVTVPAFAEGGRVTKPTLALIGEAGPEYVIPESKLHEIGDRTQSSFSAKDLMLASLIKSLNDRQKASTALLEISTSLQRQLVKVAKQFVAQRQAEIKDGILNGIQAIRQEAKREQIVSLIKRGDVATFVQDVVNTQLKREEEDKKREAELRQGITSTIKAGGITDLVNEVITTQKQKAEDIKEGILKFAENDGMTTFVTDVATAFEEREANMKEAFKNGFQTVQTWVQDWLSQPKAQAEDGETKSDQTERQKAKEFFQYMEQRQTEVQFENLGKAIKDKVLGGVDLSVLIAEHFGELVQSQTALSRQVEQLEPYDGDIEITVKTGPVLEFDSKKYVTMRDLEKAMRLTANSVIAQLRTPAGKKALGLA